MLNQIIVVGRLASDFEIKKLESGEYAKIVLAVPRSFKNANGECETDFIEIILKGNIATNTKEYCNKGDILGIKGRIQSVKVEDEYKTELIAEKVTFLSSRKADDDLSD
mgnify:CR=1 FL=1